LTPKGKFPKAKYVILEIILRDFWGDILRVRASKDSRRMNWLASPRRLANVRFSILNCYALTLKMVDRSPRLLGKPVSLIERCNIG
jgi:hypothetical protein